MNKLKQIVLIIFSILSLVSMAQNIDRPDAPILDSVTVQWDNPVHPDGDILITWEFSDSTDVRSYYIKYLDEGLGTYLTLDSVNAQTNTYLDSRSETDPYLPQTYAILAIDSSNRKSIHSDPHKTVVVSPVQKDQDCKAQVELTWNAYEGWEEGVDYYDLFSIEEGLSQYLGRFTSTEFSYLYPLELGNNSQEYYVRVMSKNGRTSTSNKIRFSPNMPVYPSFLKAEFATVENKVIHLRYNMDSLAEINNYELERSVDSMGNFKMIRQFNNFTKGNLDVFDTDVEVAEHQYFYRLNLYNNCHKQVDSTRILSSILLKVEAKTGDYSHYLDWTKYFNSLIEEDTYHLYRYNENTIPFILNSYGSTSYHQDKFAEEDFKSLVGDFCYYIEAESDYTGIVPIRSNTVCVSPIGVVEMPNAFAPNGFVENRIFKPIFAFIEPSPYYFSIYDRWGNKVFETTDYNEGWTGVKDGKKYPNGVYTYYIEYYSTPDSSCRKSGIVNLIN